MEIGTIDKTMINASYSLHWSVFELICKTIPALAKSDGRLDVDNNKHGKLQLYAGPALGFSGILSMALLALTSTVSLVTAYTMVSWRLSPYLLLQHSLGGKAGRSAGRRNAADRGKMRITPMSRTGWVVFREVNYNC